MSPLPLPLITRPAVPAAVPEPDWQEPEPAPAGDVRDETAPSSLGDVALLAGGQMTWWGESRAALSHARARAHLRTAELRAREGGIVHGLMRAQPPSVEQQCDYAKSRAWVPPGHDGGLAEGMGVVYHALVGRPAVAIGGIISGLGSRPFRSCAALLAAYLISLGLLLGLGHAAAAVLTTSALACCIGLWIGMGILASRLTRITYHAEPGNEETED